MEIQALQLYSLPAVGSRHGNTTSARRVHLKAWATALAAFCHWPAQMDCMGGKGVEQVGTCVQKSAGGTGGRGLRGARTAHVALAAWWA